MTYEEALKAIKAGSIAGFIAVIITFVMMIIAMNNNIDSGQLAFLNDPTIFIALLMYVLLSLGVWYKSRVAAVILLCLYIADKIYMFPETKGSGLLISILFIYYFAKAMQGTFVYHKLKKQKIINNRDSNAGHK